MIISVKGIQAYGFHGVFGFEKKEGQAFLIDLEMQIPDPVADRLDATADYGAAAIEAKTAAESARYDLIETLAIRIAETLMKRFSALVSAKVTVHKPAAPIGIAFSDVLVETELVRTTAYLGIGSNLGDRAGYLSGAVNALRSRDDCAVTAVSATIETEPYGVTDQPKFLNACVRVETILSAQALLTVCRSLETAAGRTRTRRWGERTLDVDVLLFGSEIINTQDLVVPHPDMTRRPFVLEPLCEIAPGAVHPVLHKTIKMLKEELLC